MNVDNTIPSERPLFSLVIRRFIGFVYNFLFVILFTIAFSTVGFILSMVTAIISSKFMGVISIIFFFLSPIATLLFMSYQTSMGRQTNGYKAMGLKIVDRNGNDISFSKSVVRSLLWVVCALPLGLGFIWALFSRSGRGLYDQILGTKVVSKEDIKIPVFSFILFILCMVIILAIFILLAALFGFISFSGFVGALMVILLFIIPSTFVLALISKYIIRRSGMEKIPLTMANRSMTLTVCAGVLFIMVAIAIPSNSQIVYQTQEARCEEEMKTIARALDNYGSRNKCYPPKLAILLKENDLSAIPKFNNTSEYIYRIEKRADKDVYMIECPKPEMLLKGMGFQPPRKCLSIQYIQGEGMIIKTE